MLETCAGGRLEGSISPERAIVGRTRSATFRDFFMLHSDSKSNTKRFGFCSAKRTFSSSAHDKIEV
jgi:hypothetical protein